MFTWNNEVNLEAFTTLFGFLFTVIGIYVTWREVKRNKQIQKAQFIMQITESFFSDAKVRSFYYKVTYGKFSLNAKDFRDSEDQQALDKLLYLFDTIGRVVKLSVVEIEDVEILSYEAKRFLGNSEVKKYLATLNESYSHEGIVDEPHLDAKYLLTTLEVHNLNKRNSQRQS